MLLLKNIVKIYTDGGNEVKALRGVNIEFRQNEFVSVLGHSGCGKTTLLNIIGGLDHYTDGDLIIENVSTKKYKDSDWDKYRNHSIGFVFQSYNLIPHQTVLANVELALTLSRVSPAERAKRAKEALEKVGLKDQIKKKPNQLSGGQMQRVAIARALVNNPEILLADEPTGALDSETSIQIMELLKEIAQNKLVIMVTHNPELAMQYSTRIVKLVDGLVVSDSMPYDSAAEAAVRINTLAEASREHKIQDEQAADTKDIKQEKGKKKKQSLFKRSMSFMTALSLSLNNLMTKKARTILTSFAGSIGIIGIALILSLSDGIQIFIQQLQEDTLSSYPITITSESVQLNDIMAAFMTGGGDDGVEHDKDKIYSNSAMFDMAKAMFNVEVHINDLNALKKEFSSENDIWNYVSDIQYAYDYTLHLYSTAPDGDLVKVNPSSIMNSIASSLGTSSSYLTSSFQICSEMINNLNLLNSQYDVVAGEWPKSYNEVVLVVDKNNELNDIYMYALGLRDPDEIEDIMNAAINGEEYVSPEISFSYDDIIGKTFSLVLPADYYRLDEDTGNWVSMKNNETYIDYLARIGTELKISAIVRPSEDSVAQSISGAIGYTHALSEYVIAKNSKNPAILAQLSQPSIDIFTGLPFDDGSLDNITNSDKALKIKDYFSGLSNSEKADIYRKIVTTPTNEELDRLVENYMKDIDTSREGIIKMIIENGGEEFNGIPSSMIESYLNAMSDDELIAMVTTMAREAVKKQFEASSGGELSQMTDEQIAQLFDAKVEVMDEDTLAGLYDSYMPPQFSTSTYERNCTLLGVADEDFPSQINIYASTFEDKDKIVSIINEYNARMVASGNDDKVIKYTDMVGLLMSSVTRIVDIVSIVLIAFVAISLVVSSIMIGVITYISVIERTKEIGILRAIGASKRDITHVFNAETTIVGFVSGVLGILVTLLLLIPANIIIEHYTSIPNIAALPFTAALILILISIVITVIAGLFPSLIAAKKDPVEALRTE